MSEAPHTCVYFNAITNTVIPNTKVRHLSQNFVDRLCQLFVRRVWPKRVFSAFYVPFRLQVTFYDTIRIEDQYGRMWHSVILYTVTIFSEELAVAILRVVRSFWTTYQSTERYITDKLTIQ